MNEAEAPGRADPADPDSAIPQPGPTAALPVEMPLRQGRRLPERLLVAAHQACDLGTLDIAASLLSMVEQILREPEMLRTVPPSAQRRVMEALVAAHERLWHLRRLGGDAG